MTGPGGLALRRAAAAASKLEKPAEPTFRIFIYGKHQDAAFQMLKAAAEYLAQSVDHVEATVEGFYETQYEQHLRYIIGKFGGSFTQSKPSAPLIYAETDDQILFFASDKLFLEYIGKKYQYEDNTRIMFYKRIGNKALKTVKDSSGRSYCDISVSINGGAKETVKFELFNEESPTLAENFLKLLASPKFDGHCVHRVKPGCWVQAGDLVDGSGLNSEAAGGGLLRHESYKIKHDRPGLLGMASHGKDTIGSQFYITLRELPFLDGKFTVIGRVIGGMRTILLISKLSLKNERPLQDVKIYAAKEAEAAPAGDAAAA
eukprot:TRINITY_DN52695_c0_g1_i1.p1 TRINITY_DN52695_c0_g1~~TRINITY_DN52695_c0_g1_i1.p1  ORF type:complete len:317 (-),score=64.88 TRINITY_DN52695_c0_g1_i1:146-1096(-)